MSIQYPLIGSTDWGDTINSNFLDLDTRSTDNSNKIGDLSTLTTTDKTSLVNAVIENTAQLSENANNIKNYGHFGLSANQSIPNSTATTGVIFNSTVAVNNGLYTLDVATGRVTVLQDGVYSVEAEILWDINAVGLRQVRIYNNSGASLSAQSTQAHDALSTVISLKTTVNLTTNQYIYLAVIQNSGASLNILANNLFTYLKIRKLA